MYEGGYGMLDTKARPKILGCITLTFNLSPNQLPSFACISESWQGELSKVVSFVESTPKFF